MEKKVGESWYEKNLRALGDGDVDFLLHNFSRSHARSLITDFTARAEKSIYIATSDPEGDYFQDVLNLLLSRQKLGYQNLDVRVILWHEKAPPHSDNLIHESDNLAILYAGDDASNTWPQFMVVDSKRYRLKVSSFSPDTDARAAAIGNYNDPAQSSMLCQYFKLAWKEQTELKPVGGEKDLIAD